MALECFIEGPPTQATGVDLSAQSGKGRCRTSLRPPKLRASSGRQKTGSRLRVVQLPAPWLLLVTAPRAGFFHLPLELSWVVALPSPCFFKLRALVSVDVQIQVWTTHAVPSPPSSRPSPVPSARGFLRPSSTPAPSCSSLLLPFPTSTWLPWPCLHSHPPMRLTQILCELSSGHGTLTLLKAVSRPLLSLLASFKVDGAGLSRGSVEKGPLVK